MKTTEKTIAVLLCIICLSACENKEVSDISENIITTEPTVSETTATTSSETTTSEPISHTTKTVAENMLYFDEEKNIPENAVYKKIILNSKRSVIFYDIHDNPILELYQTTPDKSDYSKFEHFYEYNSDGTKSSEEYDEMHGRRRFEYEYTNCLLTQKTALMNGNIQYTESYEYDEYGNVSKRTYESYDYETIIKSVHCYSYEYDDNKRILSKTTFNVTEQADTLLKEYFTYDDNGNVINIRKELGNGSTESVNYEYDSQNRLTKYSNSWNNSTEEYEYEFYK